jgi:glycosyltransferase involved in cell wall biosynthesis
MRKLYFLLPGTGGKFACGGLWVELKTVELAKQFCEAQIVTYRQREANTLFLDDLLKEKNLDEVIFVISWGFDVAKLASRLKSYNVIYHAHSSGYGFKLPSNIPIIAVSRNTMGYWGQHSPHSLIYYLPNQINDGFKNLNSDRDIDVLIQARKSSQYLLKQLVPTLEKKCQVFLVDSYVEDLAKLFNRSKVYLYDSAEYWAQQKVSEGFGMQPLEALACGCQVFSSVNGGLSDYLDPGFNCYKIAGHSLEYDVERILKAIAIDKKTSLPEEFFAEYRTENIIQRFRVILEDINTFFDGRSNYSGNIKSVTKVQIAKAFVKKLGNKLQKK